MYGLVFLVQCLASFYTHEEQRRVVVRLTGNLGAEVAVLGRRRLAVLAVRHTDRIVAEGTVVVASRIVVGDTGVAVDHIPLRILEVRHIPVETHIPEGECCTVAADMGRTDLAVRRNLGVYLSGLQLAVVDRFVGPLSWL